MTQPNPSTALAKTIMDELFRGGVRLVVISPGSRSAALAIAAAQHTELETVVCLDERSGGFHALGRAKADGHPAAVVCTSGTAAANYLPAVVEADMSLSPLVVLTADRPGELHGVGANQTIDQIDLYGNKVRSFHDIAPAVAASDGNDKWRTAIAIALAAAMGSDNRPGPVHLNVAFREPTVPVSDDGRINSPPYEFSIGGRPGGDPWIRGEKRPPPEPVIEIPPVSRGLVIAGDGDYDRMGLLESAGAHGWPVLATALSGLRGTETVGSYHHILAGPVPGALRPEMVIGVGAIGPCRRLEDLVATADVRLRVDRWGRVIDPEGSATAVLHADPVVLVDSIEPMPAREWAKSWAEADHVVCEAIDSEDVASGQWSGPVVARALNEIGWDRLVVASSLPIRDVDAHLRRGGQVLANRGASGIDGLISAALGVASLEGKTLALSGDLSLLHDSGGFLIDRPRDLVVIVVDNGGGGLFDSLPQAHHAPDYERLFVTPHRRDFENLAGLHDLEFRSVGSVTELVDEADTRLGRGGAHLLRVPVDRAADIEMRRVLDEVSERALRSFHT